MDFARARRNMIDCQIRTNKVIDPAVIEAMEAVPREAFVPASLQPIAYVDEDLHLGGGRHLMEPMVFARLAQAASISPTDDVLDVGCATGYSTAVLARICGFAVALEENAQLAETAGRQLTDLSVDNAAVVEGPLADGYAKQAPYDVILVEGAVTESPTALLDQLKDGGRLVAVMRQPVSGGLQSGVGVATLFSKTAGQIGSVELFDAAVPVLAGFEKEAGFVF